MFASNNFKVVKILLNKSVFDEHIVHIILKYYWDILDNKKKLLSNWVDKRKLTSLIYKNKYSLHYIWENRECYIDWNILSSNPDAIYLLKMHKDNSIVVTSSQFAEIPLFIILLIFNSIEDSVSCAKIWLISLYLPVIRIISYI